jgi:hypothetical protein
MFLDMRLSRCSESKRALPLGQTAISRAIPSESDLGWTHACETWVSPRVSRYPIDAFPSTDGLSLCATSL